MDIQDYFKREGLGDLKDFRIEIKTLNLKRKHSLIPLGKVANKLYYVNSGIIEAGMGEGLHRKILEFYFEGSFFTSVSSLLTQTPTDVYHTCITKCIVQEISYDELLEKSKTSIIINKFLYSFLKNQYLTRVKKEKDILTKDIHTLYEELVTQHPNVIKNISVANIARYLNIHPNSLSRIRKNVIDQQRKRIE